jgi:hypothetical protein
LPGGKLKIFYLFLLFKHSFFRRDYDHTTFCDEEMIKNKIYFAPNFNIFCDQGCSQSNELIGNTSIVCTSYSVIDNWSLGQNLFNYTLPKNKTIEISFKGNFWIELVSLETNRHNAYWELRAKYNTSLRSDTYRMNSSPITLIPPVIKIQRGKIHDIKIPTADLDDDLVKCRWSKFNECASICSYIKNANLYSNCNLKFNATDAPLGWYAIAIQIEDFKSFNDSNPLSSVPIQFLILIVENSPSICSKAPVIVEPQQTCYIGKIFEPINLKIIAKSSCKNVTIKEMQILGPMGSIKSDSFILNSSLWYSNFSWTPFKNGVYFICVTAIDSMLFKSNLSCFSILVNVMKPQIIPGTQFPIDIVDSDLIDSKFKIQFDSFSIQKPNLKSAYIRLYSQEGKELTKINTKNSIEIQMNQILFHLNFNFSLDKWYFILLDSGVVVGDDKCRPESENMINSSLWKFKYSKLNKISSINKNDTDSNKCDFINFTLIFINMSLLLIFFHIFILKQLF